MTIYYEVLFFINCFIHYALSKTIARFLNIKLNYKKQFISYIIICINLYLYINFDFYKYFKFIIGYVLSYITFNTKSIKVFLIYLSANIFLAGTTVLYELYNYKTIILSIVPVIIIYEIISSIIDRKRKDHYLYQVIFKLDKIYKIKAFLDTGNDLTEPKTNVPVVIVSINILLKKSVKIPYSTINNDDVMEGVYCPKFYIKMDNKYIRKDVFVVNKKTKYDGLLNILLF